MTQPIALSLTAHAPHPVTLTLNPDQVHQVELHVGPQGPPGQDANIPDPTGVADGRILATSGESWVITAPPSGTGGTGGDGVTFIQDTAPILAGDKETWWNPTTKQLKVYNSGVWGSVAPNGGFF